MLFDRIANATGAWEAEDLSVRVNVPEARIIIASDVHIPYYDKHLLQRLFYTAQAMRIEAIVWLGDLMDMPTFSPWGTDDTSTTFERELRVTEAVLRTAADLGIRQYWSLGNHEERLLRKLCHEVSMERLADMARVSDLVESGNLVVSENPSLTHGEDWILTHPAQYGSSPLAVPGYLADVEQKNLVAGHSHHWGLGKSPSGKFTVVESGGIFEPTFMRYLAHRPSKHRAQCKGFVVLDHGVPHLVDGAGESRSLGI